MSEELNKTGRAIIFIDDKIISIKRTKIIDKIEKIYYTLPGGHVENNETFEEATIREVYEELGINVEIINQFAHIYNNDLNRDEKFFICKLKSGTVGTGTGPEWNEYNVLYGKYEIIFIDVNKIKEYNLLPIEIKDMLIRKYCN